MKKIIGLIMAVVLAVGFCTPVMAVRKYIVNNIVSSPFGYYEENAAIKPEDTQVGDKIIIPILAQGFKDSDGQDVVWRTENFGTVQTYYLGPTVGELKANGIKPILWATAGKELIKDYKFVKYTPTRSVPAQAALEIEFTDDLVSTSEVRYEFTIYLQFRGGKFDTQETYGGKIANTIVDLYDFDYVYLDGDVGKCHFSKDEVRVGLGNGVYLYSDMQKDERYYGKAKLIENLQEDLISRSYSQITDVYELTSINLRTHGDIVEFTVYDKPHYVYNLRGEYLGTTTDRLPYSQKYYVAKELIEIDVDLEELEEDIARYYGEEFPSAAVDLFTQGIQEETVNNQPE